MRHDPAQRGPDTDRRDPRCHLLAGSLLSTVNGTAVPSVKLAGGDEPCDEGAAMCGSLGSTACQAQALSQVTLGFQAKSNPLGLGAQIQECSVHTLTAGSP